MHKIEVWSDKSEINTEPPTELLVRLADIQSARRSGSAEFGHFYLGDNRNSECFWAKWTDIVRMLA